MPEIRNFIGYGNNPPLFRWDNNAKLAVQFVLNYEEGGENTVLNCLLYTSPSPRD